MLMGVSNSSDDELSVSQTCRPTTAVSSYILTNNANAAPKRKLDSQKTSPDKKIKMNDSTKAWSQRSAEVLLKRLQTIQLKRKNALSQYELAFRWKCRAANSAYTSQTVPVTALTKFRKMLFAKKVTHRFFYPVLVDPIEEDTGNIDDGINENGFKIEQTAVSLYNEPKSNDDKMDEYDFIDISSDNEMESISEGIKRAREDIYSDRVLGHSTSTHQETNANVSEGVTRVEERNQQECGVPCPVCNKSFSRLLIEDHATQCASEYFKD